MRPERISLETITNEIKKRKIVKIKDLIETINCSVWTLFNKLKRCEYNTSINLNRQYITLKDIPTFDPNGLWKYQGVIFSRWGNVEKSIIQIVNKSPMGLSTCELHNIFQMRTHNQLHRLVKKQKLTRVRSGRNQLFFSIDKKIQKHQKEKREETLERPIVKESTRPKYITNKIIIAVLVVVIKHHETSPEKIISIMASEGTKVSKRAIRWIFDKYEIEKKGSP